MNCPHCETQAKHPVKETLRREGDIVRSRRCGQCGKLFGTREAVDSTLGIGVGRGKNPNSHNRPVDVLRVWK